MGTKHKPLPFAYIRGQVVPIDKAQISLMTNALHYGGAVFEGVKAYVTKAGVQIFRLEDHIYRMARSCKILRFTYGFSHNQIKEKIIELAKHNQIRQNTYIRPIIYRSDLELSPGLTGEYDLAVYMLYMDNYFDPGKGLSAMVSNWTRNSDNAIPPRTKATGGYINSSLAIHDAQRAGYDSAIFLDEHGKVSEGAVMNIFLIKDGVIFTPGIDSDALEGITRKTIFMIARELGYETVERTINRSELYTADEIFFSGTATEVTWCSAVDGVRVTSREGKITKKIKTAFHDLSTTHPELFTPID